MSPPAHGVAPPPAGDTAARLRALRPRVAAARAASDAARPARPSLPALDLAAAHTDVGVALPPLDHLGPLRRALATMVGRLLLYFLRLLSIDQTRFNRLAIDALGEVASRARRDQESAQTALAAAADAASAAAAAERAALAADLATARTTSSERAAEQAAALAALREQQAALQRDVGALRHDVAALQDATTWLRTQSDVLRRRAAAGAAAPAATTGATASTAPAPAEREHGAHLEAWMVAEAFRGDESAVRERLRRYVPLFAGRRDVLDVGCGRGEFLELLREAGVPARGVDLDRDMTLWGREKGLDVTCGDALAELARLPAGSLGGVFCAQVVEHLATADMLRLVELAAHALRPDGVLVIETLNPESLLVLYRWFWVDLTHERLVHPETLRIVFQTAGLRDVEVRFVPRPDDAVRLPLLEVPGADPARLADFNRATQYLNDLLYGSFDYAVIGVR